MKFYREIVKIINQISGKENMFGYKTTFVNQLYLWYCINGKLITTDKLYWQIKWLLLTWHLTIVSSGCMVCLWCLWLNGNSTRSSLYVGFILLEIIAITITLPVVHYLHATNIETMLDQMDVILSKRMPGRLPNERDIDVVKMTKSDLIPVFVLYAIIYLVCYFDVLLFYEKDKVTNPMYYTVPFPYVEQYGSFAFLSLTTLPCFVANVLLFVEFWTLGKFFEIWAALCFNETVSICQDLNTHANAFIKKNDDICGSTYLQIGGSIGMKKLSINREFNRHLITCVRDFQDLTSAIEEIRELYELIASIYLIIGFICNIAHVYLFLLTDFTLAVRCKEVALIIFPFVILFIICKVGDIFDDLVTQMSFEIYSTPWYLMLPRFRRDVLQTLCQTQNTIKIKAIQFHPINSILSLGVSKPDQSKSNRKDDSLQPSSSAKPADETAKKDSSPEKSDKKAYSLIRVDNGAIFFDDKPVYIAPPSKMVQVKAGRIFIDKKLAFDYNTGKTYIAPVGSKTRKSLKTRNPSTPFNLNTKGVLSANNNEVYKVPLHKSISWKDNRIYIDGKIAYDVNTATSHIKSYQGEQQEEQLIDNDDALFTQVSKVETQKNSEESKPPTPAQEEPPKPSAKVSYYFVDINNGEILIDGTHVYTAAPDTKVSMKNGQLYVNDDLAYDYNTNITYRPPDTLPDEEIESPLPEFSICYPNGNIMIGDELVYRVPRMETISWQNGQIFINDRLAFDVRTSKKYIPSYQGPNYKYDKELLKITDGKVVKGVNDDIYVDDVLVQLNDPDLHSQRVNIEVEDGILKVNGVPVMEENPEEWSFEFPTENFFSGGVTRFEIIVRDGKVLYSDDSIKNKRL